jgi:uncharacterized membrane protein YuzA (DUF378 family)
MHVTAYDLVKQLYRKVKLQQLMMGLVLIGAINATLSSFGYDIIHQMGEFTGIVPLSKILYILIGISAVKLLVCRNTWLPFLGRSVLPGSVISLKANSNKTDTVVTIKTKPNAKIVYWAALPKGNNPDVITAYGDYSNSGVVMSDKEGIAKLNILAGSSYTVPPCCRIVPRHVHYRVVGLLHGMAGPVKTINY